MPLLALEADSYWHEDPRQKDRDATKDFIFESGGVSLIRLRPFGKPSDAAIKGDIANAVATWLRERPVTGLGDVGFDPVDELDLTQVKAWQTTSMEEE